MKRKGDNIDVRWLIYTGDPSDEVVYSNPVELAAAIEKSNASQVTQVVYRDWTAFKISVISASVVLEVVSDHPVAAAAFQQLLKKKVKAIK